MLTGHFYYIRDEYFRDFQDEKLMSNKEISQGQAHVICTQFSGHRLKIE